MSADTIEGFPDDTSNAIANQLTYDNPQLLAIANSIAHALGVSSLDDLSPDQQKTVRMILYTVANNVGDSAGLLNSGNLFINMQQGVLHRRGGSDTIQGGLIGATPGSATAVMQRAAMLTQIAQGLYYNPNGTVNRDIVGDMDPSTYSAYAAAAANRVEENGGVRTYHQKESGASGLGKTIDEALSGGVDKTQSSIASMRDLERKSAAYEQELNKYEKELKGKDANYKTIKERQAAIKELEKATGDNFTKLLTDDEKQIYAQDPTGGRNKIIQGRKRELEIQRNGVEDVVDEKVKGREFKAETVKGVQVKASKMSDMDLSLIHDVERGTTQFDAYSSDYANRVRAAIISDVKPVAELEKILGVNNYPDLKKTAKALGLPDIDDPKNSQDIINRIRHAKRVSATTGRPMQSVLQEQSQITELFRQMTGGDDPGSDIIMQTQDIGQRAAAHREQYGRGPTQTEATVQALQNVMGYMDERDGIALAVTKKAVEDKNSPLNDKQKKEARKLLRQAEHAETEKDMSKASHAIRQFAKNNRLLESQRDVEDAASEYGMYVANVWSGETVAHNTRLHIQDMTPEQMKQYDKGTRKILQGIRNGDEDSVKWLYETLGQNGVDSEFMDAVGDKTFTKKEINSLVQKNVIEPMRAQGADEKDVQKSARLYKQYMSLPVDMRKFLRREMEDSKANVTRRTRAQDAREKTVTSEAVDKEEFLHPEEGRESHGTIPDIIEGILEGQSKTPEDAAVVRGWVKEELKDHQGLSQRVGWMRALNMTNSELTAFDIDTQKNRLNNKDVLEKEVGTVNGKMPIWKAMGFQSLKAAQKKAHGARLYEGLNQLGRATGGKYVHLDDKGHVVLAPNNELQYRKAHVVGDPYEIGKQPSDTKEEENKTTDVPDEKDLPSWGDIKKTIFEGGGDKINNPEQEEKLALERNLGMTFSALMTNDEYENAAKYISNLRKDPKYKGKGIEEYDPTKMDARQYVWRNTIEGKGISVQDAVKMLSNGEVLEQGGSAQNYFTQHMKTDFPTLTKNDQAVAPEERKEMRNNPTMNNLAGMQQRAEAPFRLQSPHQVWDNEESPLTTPASVNTGLGDREKNMVLSSPTDNTGSGGTDSDYMPQFLRFFEEMSSSFLNMRKNLDGIQADVNQIKSKAEALT